MHVYTASNRRDDVIMVTVFPSSEVCRITGATYDMEVKHIGRATMAAWFRYWRRCGWTITREQPEGANMNDPREQGVPSLIEVRIFENGSGEINNRNHEYVEPFDNAYELARFMSGYQRAGDIIVFVNVGTNGVSE